MLQSVFEKMLGCCHYAILISMLHYTTLMLALDPIAVDEGQPWNIMRHPVDHRIPNEIPLVKHSRKSHHFHASYTCSPKNVQQIKSVGNIPLSPRSQEWRSRPWLLQIVPLEEAPPPPRQRSTTRPLRSREAPPPMLEIDDADLCSARYRRLDDALPPRT